MDKMKASPDSARTKLLDAALRAIRTKGYAATTVDGLCAAAGVSKGSFFHHFSSKEELALAAARHFSEMADGLFAQAPFAQLTGARERVLGYVDTRAAILSEDLAECTCLLGTMVQETYETHPAIREACDMHIRDHAAAVAGDIAKAKTEHAPDASWSSESLALFTQAVLQGAFILAKAHHDTGVARDCLAHLRRYLEHELPQ
jgi:TetR/AcrR family transcriptional repressor of nem operon